jgi:hypothetical protein
MTYFRNIQKHNDKRYITPINNSKTKLDSRINRINKKNIKNKFSLNF